MEQLNIDIGGAKGNTRVPERWKIMDVRPCDYHHDLNSRLPFPLADNTVDNYYTSMTLMNVWIDNIQYVVNEMGRTLKPGGKCRVVVPDTSIAMRAYLEKPSELSLKRYPKMGEDWPDLPVLRLLAWFYSQDKNVKLPGHSGVKIIFDKQSLTYYFGKAGFNVSTIQWLEHGVCSEVFEGRDNPRWGGWSFYMEIEK